MGSLNQQGDVNAAAIAVNLGYLYILLFTLVKVVGAAMAIDVQLTSDASLYTPAAILSTVVLSPLLLGLGSLMNPGKEVVRNLRSPMARHIPRILRLNHFVIIASLALGILGGLDAFSASLNTGSIENGKLYLCIAAGLSVAAWVLIFLYVSLSSSSSANAKA